MSGVQAPEALPRPRRAWLTVLLCALIFAGGGVVGAGITAMHVGRQAREAIAHPDLMPKRLMHRLKARLDLSDEQARRIEAVVVRRSAHILKARESLLQNVDPEFMAIRREILPLLRTDQTRRFEQLFSRMRETWLPGPAAQP